MSKCKQNDCGWCYDKSGMSNDTNGACLSPSSCAANNWPTDDHISNVAHNGEVDAPTYEIDETLWRLNPAGLYALYWHKGVWRVSAVMTNQAVVERGKVVS